MSQGEQERLPTRLIKLDRAKYKDGGKQEDGHKMKLTEGTRLKDCFLGKRELASPVH